MNTNTCPHCRAAIPTDAPGGLCPSCALLGVVQPTVIVPPVNAAAREEVAAAFPELEIMEMIGQGGMGVVFKVRQPRLDRLVALKILPPHLAAQPGFAERFTREARALARLNHPHIVTVYDFGESGGFYYLLMEFVDGVNLRKAMQAGVKPEQAMLLVPQICEALQFAHDHGVLHRDIKPENILLDVKGTPKLADFGIAKLAGDVSSGLTMSGAQLGTASYMAPEQIEKPATVDHRADIYSLGVVFYEMLTGELPLGRFAAPSEKSAVSEGVDAVVLRALEKERDRRQQSAGEMKTLVEGASACDNARPTHRRDAVPGPNRDRRGWESVSPRRLFGMPLFHIVRGPDPATGIVPVARGFFAAGPVARGFFAVGGQAGGFIAVGGAAAGVVAIGGLTTGVFAFGGLTLGVLFAAGGLAVAPLAIGGSAVGLAAIGGSAFALEARAATLLYSGCQPLGDWFSRILLVIKVAGGISGLAAVALFQMSFFAREPSAGEIQAAAARPPHPHGVPRYFILFIVAFALMISFFATGRLLWPQQPSPPPPAPAVQAEIRSEAGVAPQPVRTQRSTDMVMAALDGVTAAQLGDWLASCGRSAEALTAAWELTHDAGLEAELAEKHAGSAHVCLALLTDMNGKPREEWVERVRKVAPDHPLPDCLAAAAAARSGDFAAVQAALARALGSKGRRDFYTTERMILLREAAAAAGLDPGIAAFAPSRVLRSDAGVAYDLAGGAGALMKSARQSDAEGAAQRASAALTLTGHYATGSHDNLAQSLVRASICTAAARYLPPDTEMGDSGLTLAEVTNRAAHVKEIAGRTSEVSAAMEYATPAEVTAYFDHWMQGGEVAAMQWALERLATATK